MVIILLLLGAIVGGLSVIFVLQNITPITVTYFTWQIEGSLAVVLLLAMLSGAIVTMLTLLPTLIRDEWRYAKLRKEKEAVESELATTRKVINDVAGRAVVVEPAPSAML